MKLETLSLDPYPRVECRVVYGPKWILELVIVVGEGVHFLLYSESTTNQPRASGTVHVYYGPDR